MDARVRKACCYSGGIEFATLTEFQRVSSPAQLKLRRFIDDSLLQTKMDHRSEGPKRASAPSRWPFRRRRVLGSLNLLLVVVDDTRSRNQGISR